MRPAAAASRRCGLRRARLWPREGVAACVRGRARPTGRVCAFPFCLLVPLRVFARAPAALGRSERARAGVRGLGPLNYGLGASLRQLGAFTRGAVRRRAGPLGYPFERKNVKKWHGPHIQRNTRIRFRASPLSSACGHLRFLYAPHEGVHKLIDICEPKYKFSSTFSNRGKKDALSPRISIASG